MHERKAKMHLLSNAFVVLPGGFGTADETFETITWRQLGIHRKPIGLLDVGGYWTPLLAWIDRAVTDGFIDAAEASGLGAYDDVEFFSTPSPRKRPLRAVTATRRHAGRVRVSRSARVDDARRYLEGNLAPVFPNLPGRIERQRDDGERAFGRLDRAAGRVGAAEVRLHPTGVERVHGHDAGKVGRLQDARP